MSQKILLEKNKERKNRKSEEKKRRRRKKKAMAALVVFVLTSLKIVFERKNCLKGELYFGCNVFQKSSCDICFSYSCA